MDQKPSPTLRASQAARRLRWLLFTGTLLALQACGGGADLTKAHVRLVNASTDPSALSLTVDGKTIASAVAYGASADYADASRGTQSLVLFSSSSAASQKTISADLGKDKSYTLLAFGRAGALSSVLLDDNLSSADSGKASLRLFNAAPDAGSVDVYLTGSGDPLAAATALQTGVAFGAVGSTLSITSGPWRLRVTGSGDKNDLRLDVDNLNFDSTSVKTLVLTPGPGGVLLNALLLGQQAAVVQAANAQARLRVVAGVAEAAVVTATLAGRASPLVNGVASPALTEYQLVGAGPSAITVTANGISTGLNAITLGGGGDHTLLVFGTASAPRALLIQDDNARPEDSSRAKLRLVHGLADVAGDLALKVDLVVSASGVGAGSASAYRSTAASSTAALEVGSADGTLATYRSSDRTLAANGVYTLFMLGRGSAPTGALVKDR